MGTFNVIYSGSRTCTRGLCCDCESKYFFPKFIKIRHTLKKNQALPETKMDLYSLNLIGGMEMLRQDAVNYFEYSFAKQRISLLYDKIKWRDNNIPFWVRVS